MKQSECKVEKGRGMLFTTTDGENFMQLGAKRTRGICAVIQHHDDYHVSK